MTRRRGRSWGKGKWMMRMTMVGGYQVMASFVDSVHKKTAPTMVGASVFLGAVFLMWMMRDDM